MLIIDRTQRTWAVLSLGICAIASAVYVVYATSALNGPSGGSLPGLIFGIIAAAMMIFAGLLAARRRFPAARLGSAQFWMRGHLWIGGLTVPFALFHAGFGWGGRLEVLLWLLFFAVILSGFWGLALQQLLPRMMLEQIPRETFIEQIPHLCLQFTAESDRLLADICGPLEVSLAPTELQQFQPHLWPHFEEDRKKNRNDYPKTAPEAEQFQIFLAKVYAGVKVPTVHNAPDAATKPPVVPVPPVVKSVAQVTPPETPAEASSPTTSSTETSAPSKPDPKAMLAAMKAKKEAAAATTTTPPAPPEVSPPNLSTPVPPSEVPVASPKPDPKAMLAAMKAKKEAAAAAALSAAVPEPTAMNPVTPVPPAEALPVAPSKPDPKALLAAARAKKAQAASEPSTVAAVPAVESVPTPSDSAPVVPPPAATGKPDPKAMLAAMKAKKEAAAMPSSAAVVTDKPNPLAALRAVKDPAEAPPALTSAMKIAPPSPAQLAELKLFYLESIRPQLPLCSPSRSWMEAMRRATLACRIRQNSVHPRFVEVFDKLHDVSEQRRQFAFVHRYHRWLHGWLLVHIPATVALYAILAVHAISALRVIPFGN